MKQMQNVSLVQYIAEKFHTSGITHMYGTKHSYLRWTSACCMLRLNVFSPISLSLPFCKFSRRTNIYINWFAGVSSLFQVMSFDDHGTAAVSKRVKY